MYTIYEHLGLCYTFNLASEYMVQSFFSAIAYRLENNKWGSVYPVIMNELYKGKLERKNVKRAIIELKDIKQKFQKINLSLQIMKNMNNEYLDKEIPIELGTPINLDDYFVNDDNKRITDIMLMVLEKIKNKKIPN